MSEKTDDPTKRPTRWATGAGGPTRQFDLSLEDAKEAAADFLRRNPWVAVAGAAVASGILEAMIQNKSVRRGSSRAAVRDWVDDSYATLPTRRQFESVAKTAGIPTTLPQLKAKLVED